MSSTRTAAANAERKVAARTIQVRRTDRGFSRASEQTFIDAGHAIYKPLWSANNEATLLAMIEKHATLLATHEANPVAKEAQSRSTQIDSLTVRLDSHYAQRRKACQALSDGIDEDDAKRVCNDPGFKAAIEEGDPAAVLRALSRILRFINPTDSYGDYAYRVSTMNQGLFGDVFEFFSK